MHAEVLRERGQFCEVHCAFLKEEPWVADALEKIHSEDVVIVPDFLAEGYFTRQVIPGLLKLDTLPDTVRYCAPVGTHPMMQELIAQSAEGVAGDWRPDETSLLLVGHGSTKNSHSKLTLLDHVQALREKGSFVEIVDGWLEEEPFIQQWQEVVTRNKVIVVPFLLSDGQHGGWDIPEMLGIDKTQPVHGVTHQLGGRDVRVAPALGTNVNFVKAIERVAMQTASPSD
jgi:sirohydrochlorin cobaltochelatase